MAIFAYWASHDLPGMRGFAFGPGTAPRGFAMVLGALGLAVSITGLMTKGPGIDRFYLRGPFFITLSVVLFAWMVRPLGLVIASFLSIMAAAGATPDARMIETLIWGAVLTAFCCLLFPYALNLPMQLWPNSWDSGRRSSRAFRLDKPMNACGLRPASTARVNQPCLTSSTISPSVSASPCRR